MPNKVPSPKSFLGSPITAEYAPLGYPSLFTFSRNRPVFTPLMIREMLSDPRILFGLWLLKGPIQDKAKFEIECDDQGVSDFCLRQIERFWRNSLPSALKAFEWGYSGSEVLYNVRTAPVTPVLSSNPNQPPPGSGQPPGFGMAFPPSKSKPRPDIRRKPDRNNSSSTSKGPSQYPPGNGGDGGEVLDDQAAADFAAQPSSELFIEFDRLKDIHSQDLKAVTLKGDLCGMYIQRSYDRTAGMHRHVYLGEHKKFWHVHWPEHNPWYGLSRLFGCHIPWWEKWSDGGFRDIRRLWFHKNAFDGGTFYFPFGGSMRDELGNIVTYRDLARELIEKKRTGGMLFLPNTVVDERGTRQWEYIEPKTPAVPAGLLDYGALLDKEILEGLGVPTEIIESSGEQGFGAASGRQVPETAFYAILQGLINPLIENFKRQVLEPLVAVNFGPGIDFEVIPTPITASTDPASDPAAMQPPGEDPNAPPDESPPEDDQE